MKLLLLILIGLSFQIFSQKGDLVLNKDSLLIQNLNEINRLDNGSLKKKDNILLKETYVARGLIYCDELDQYDSALFYFNKAIGNNLLELDSNLYSKSISGIAKVYGMTKRIDEAITKHNEAISIQESRNDTLSLIKSLYELGICYYDIKRDTSILIFRKANELAVKLKYNKYIAITYRAFGQFYLDLKEIDSAIFYLQKAEPILYEEEEYYDVCNLNLQFALLYSRKENYNKAIFYASKAQKVADKYGYLQLLKNVHDVFTEIYYYKGDCDGALENLQLKHSIVDSMRSLKVQKNIEELTIQYEVNLKEEKNRKLQSEVNSVRLSKKNDRFLFFIILLIALILIGGTYSLYRSKKRKLVVSDMKIKLSEGKKRELLSRLENAQTVILKKNKLIERLKEDLEENILNEDKSKRLLDKLNTKNEWSEFLIEFEMLHTDFFYRLNNSVIEPLTKNDIRLSALIRLNLSNKEISDLLYVSDSAVKKAKNRLTKKIKLDKGERLGAYMNRL